MKQSTSTSLEMELGQQIETIHPLLLKVIRQAQPALLEPNEPAQESLEAVLRYALRKSKSWPKTASPELHLAIDGLLILTRSRKMNLSILELTLEYRKAQMIRAIFPPKDTEKPRLTHTPNTFLEQGS